MRGPVFGSGQVGNPPAAANGRFGNAQTAPYGRGTPLPGRYPSGAAVIPSLSTNLFGTRYGTPTAVSNLQRQATLILRGGG
jgi:hypothetical protein